MESAKGCFAKAHKLRQSRPGLTPQEKSDELLDLALIAIAENDFAAAMSSLQDADKLDGANPAVINNLAVCHLYLGKLRDGLAFLEAKITANPALLLHETPILNLCTLYELESSYAGQKKQAILDLVGQYKGAGMNASCLKLQM